MPGTERRGSAGLRDKAPTGRSRPRSVGEGAGCAPRRFQMIAALYVETNGVYYNLPHVDPWDEARDARLYAGPWPVVAHPPCARWGRYFSGGPSARVRRKLGDDGGCF